ncbi:response regulator [candidate division KSB1 bacterium]
MKLLLIDDEQAIIESLKQSLEPTGYKLVTFVDPLEGVAAYKNDHFDVVIIDLLMPNMNGIEVLRTFRNHNPKSYVIILTGYANVDKTIEAVNNGAYAFFRKPFDYKVFINTLFKIEEKLQIENKKQIYYKQLVIELENFKKTFQKIQNINKKLYYEQIKI